MNNELVEQHNNHLLTQYLVKFRLSFKVQTKNEKSVAF